MTPEGFEAGKVSLSGRVTLTGTLPQADITHENEGAKKWRDVAPRGSENWKISEDGGLAEVIIEVVDAPLTAPMPRDKIIQEDYRFIPRVAFATRGQTIEVVNNDNTIHNVRVIRHQVGTLDKGRSLSNHSQPNKGHSCHCAFLEPGVYRLESDIYRSMQAWVYVFEHDHIAISQTDGNYNLKRALKDGTYTVRAWHPQFAHPLEQKVNVNNGLAKVDFNFNAENAIK